MEFDELIQDTLSDNIVVFERIKSELQNARKQILVAMSWFTDQELFSVLEEKAHQGIEISIILSDQPDNYKLNFEALQPLGVEVVRVKNVGWGLMHQKFCVIDEELAITGSYNWSVNARTNNHESVIVTNLPKTVSQLIAIFNDIKTRASRLAGGESIDDIESTTLASRTITNAGATPEQKRTKPQSFEEQSLTDFKTILDTLIDSEVASFDQDMLKNIGYIRSKTNNGDFQIIPQAMDSLYHNFINDVDVIEEKKKRLYNKIQEQQKLVISTVEINTESEIRKQKENSAILLESEQKDIERIETEIETLGIENELIIETKIPFVESEINDLKRKISEHKIEFVKPPINWPMFTLCISMLVFLALYIFVFYSSVAYIFIFSQQDIKEQIARSITTETPDVFNPYALTKVWSKGAGGIMFLFLFVSIPLVLGMINLFTKKSEANTANGENNLLSKIWSKISPYKGIILILVVDTFIAYKVAKNVNNIEYLTNVTNEQLSALDLLTTDNFWLVFILGTLGVYLFEKVINKLFELLEARNPTLQQNKSKVQIKEYEQLIEDKNNQIADLRVRISDNKSSIVQKSLEKRAKELLIREIPIKLNDSLIALNQDLIRFKERIVNLSNIYLSQIDNDKIPISVDALHDRINIFLEGWSKYLHEVFSTLIAERKTLEAITEVDRWKQIKSIKHKVI
ncbi:hypothetical protein GCM10010967_13180 [Dyadobacter beijingensis]|uniref:phospholipase D n=1 Tax=Dyadobacter beijingensis TaxID=365489 RepID=A0ABQ2HM98_9BACT|nr:phospholipase D-like domain-containing protein [Dyadobacter beijingensis]GGM82824.1 hypothetical protein GCM10010967_13180 [Dyadobacter beijingensis]